MHLVENKGDDTHMPKLPEKYILSKNGSAHATDKTIFIYIYFKY